MIGDEIKSGLLGRTTIGIVDSEKVEVDLNVTTAHTQSYNVDHPQYPVEVDPSNPTPGAINDHVVHKDSTIQITAIVSDTVDILSGFATTTAIEKLRILVKWQRTGALVTIQGYGSGGLAGAVGGLLGGGGLSDLLGADMEESFYLGTDREEVKNMLIGNITMERSRNQGADIQCKITFKRAQLASARSSGGTTSVDQGMAKTSAAPGQTPPQLT